MDGAHANAATPAEEEKMRELRKKIASLHKQLSEHETGSVEWNSIYIREVPPLQKEIEDQINVLRPGPVREEFMRIEGEFARIAPWTVRPYTRKISEEEYRLAEANQNAGQTNSERLKNKRAFQLAERSKSRMRDSGKQQS
jgi:hypothetical protein